mgnify:CR=1 FL=1
MRDFAAALVLIVIMAMLVAAGWWLRGEYEAYLAWVDTPIVEAADPVPPPPCGDYWVVGPGDTLWQIAARCYPGEHTGQMVAAIREANPGVDPGRLRVGQVLQLPVATEIAGGAE